MSLHSTDFSRCGACRDESAPLGRIALAVGLAAYLLSAAHLSALTISGYDPGLDNRFSSGFTTNPVANVDPSFVGLDYDFSGVSWQLGTGLSGGSRVSNTTLITPLNPALNLHASTELLPGRELDYVNSSGQLLPAIIASMNGSITVPGASTDFAIGTLTQAFTADQNVAVYRVLDVSSRSYSNLPLLVYGSQADGTGPRIGTAHATGNASWAGIGSNPPAGEAQTWEGGDSNSPAFIAYTAPDGSKQLTLMGTAWYPNSTTSYLPTATYNPVAPLNNAIKGTGYALKWTIYDNPADPTKTATGWTGGAGSTNFSNAANWSSGVVPGSLPILLDADTANAQTTLSLGGNTTVRGMLFKASTSTNGFTFDGSGILTLDYSGVRNEAVGTQTFNVPIKLANSQNWEAVGGDLVFNGAIDTGSGNLVVIGGAKDTTINAAISGTGSLAKDDAGTLTLNAANTYSGGTIIHNGTVRLGAGGGLAASTPLTFIAGNAAATLDLNGVTQTLGEVSSQYGGAGHILLGGAALTVNSTANGSNGYVGTIEENGSVIKSGTGTWTLAGSNTYSGDTRIDGGALRLLSGQALPSTSNLVLNGGVVELGAGDLTQSLGAANGQVRFTAAGGFSAYGATRTVNLGGAGSTLTWAVTPNFLANGSALILSNANSNATVNFQNSIDLNAATRVIQVDNGSAAVDARYNGVLSNGGLNKTGAGTLELSQSNTYTGETLVSGGSLLVTAPNAIGSGRLYLTGALILGSEDFTRSLGTGAGQVQVAYLGGFAAYGANRVVNLGGAGATVTLGQGSHAGSLLFGATAANAMVDFQNGINLNQASDTDLRQVTINNGSAAIDAKISGNITGTGGFYLGGDGGALELSGSNSYTGVTRINSGELLITGAAALGNGNMELNGGVLTLGSGDFTRSLGTGVGQVKFTSGGGFGAYGTDRVVNLGGAGASVTWGQGSFVATGQALKFSGAASNAMVDFKNSINFNGQSAASIQVANGSSAIDARLSGVLSNGGFKKVGSGTLELASANTYSGQTLLSGGVLLLSNSKALGGGNLYLNGGVLGLGSGDFTRALGSGAGQVQAWGGGGWAAFGADRTVNLGGSGAQITWGANNPGGLGNNSSAVPVIFSDSNADATVNFQNPIDLAQNAIIQVNDGTAAVDARMNGAITSVGNLAPFTKTGSGTLELTSTGNSYMGSTIVSAGTLIVSGALNGGTAVQIQSSANFNYSGATGLSADVTIDGGTFIYNSANPFSGGLTFNSGMLAGTGNLGSTAVTIDSGKIIAPGNSPGTLRTGSEIWGTEGAYQWQINSLAGSKGAAVGWDWLDTMGTLDISASPGSGAFSLDLQALGALVGWNPNSSYIWTIASASGGVTGFDSADFLIDFSAFADSNPLNGGTFGLQVTGNDLNLVFTAVPEPGTLALLGLGGALLLLARSRHARSWKNSPTSDANKI